MPDRSGKEAPRVRKVSDIATPTPVGHPWKTLFESLSEFSSDFMEEREQPSVQIRANAFE